jgi:dTDP-4-amino-4,6-dideoxygalactose transaminase
MVDVRDDFNMDPASLERAVETARREGLRPTVVVPVDLFGHPADYPALHEVAATYDLLVLADAAQSFGAQLAGRQVGTLGDATATSFFPAKPLGCFGDGGAVFTDDDDLADVLRSLRAHGGGRDKYDNIRIGINGRLDTIQAAILLEKLKIYPDEIERRQVVSDRYSEGLGHIIATPKIAADVRDGWAQYTVRTNNRDSLAAACKSAGIPTAIYYPAPLHRQTAYAQFPVALGGAPVSEQLAREVLSLPMHPYLSAEDQARVVNVISAGV